MATVKKSGLQSKQTTSSKPDLLWRKPITLEPEDEIDPLATLYRGRESSEVSEVRESESEKPVRKKFEPTTEKSAKPKIVSEKSSVKNESAQIVDKKIVEAKTESLARPPEVRVSATAKISEPELKAILKIKSEAFEFTDIREILRGKSLDIYAYLRCLSGDLGTCKIKHLDLMKILEISRPTLFKQGEWLTKLLLIEKRNVPGDHFGTSYIVNRLEDVLPVSDAVVQQLQSHIESYRQNNR